MQRTGTPAQPADRTTQVGCPLGDAGCTFDARTRRHKHTAPLLDQLGERCHCGANSWAIRFGGVLPAMVCCQLCGASFNIGQRLRDCGKQVVRHATGRGRVT